MKLSEIKKRMKSYIDFYGGDLIGIDEIDQAKTEDELDRIIESHRRHMEDMLLDAMTHLDEFKQQVGLK